MHKLTSVNKEHSRKQSRYLRRIAEFTAYSTDGSEQLHEAQRLNNDNDPEREEMTSVHLQR